MENFELDMETNHWHIYVDGTSWGMVIGEDTSQVLQGLEPGEHRVEVYLSIDMHRELIEGDAITINISE